MLCVPRAQLPWILDCGRLFMSQASNLRAQWLLLRNGGEDSWSGKEMEEPGST